ncbi:MAG TPA: hypothetical protein VIT19_10605 [Pyrinomonadaceae bacterium]
MKSAATKLAPPVNVPNPMEIMVSNVEALYAAVNNVKNAGKTIVLKAGTYVLTRHFPPAKLTNERPNQGRLELQRNMSLRGSGIRRREEIPSLCVLETSPTDTPHFDVVPGARSGMIRTGRGNHTIANLKIIAPPKAGSGISTDLPDRKSQETTIRISKVISGDPNSEHGTRGVDIRNTGTAVVGRHLKAFIQKCEFHGGTQGIRIANFQGANGCQVTVEMSDNHCHDNFAGCLITNHRSTSGVIEVRSERDRFTENGVGCTVIGGIVNGSSNRTKFVANKIVSQSNNGPLDQATRHAGGIVVRGANTLEPNLASDNQVEIVFTDCIVNSNQAPGNVLAHGAHCSNPAGVAGKNNKVTVSLQGNNDFTVDPTNSEPPESPPETNSVTVT